MSARLLILDLLDPRGHGGLSAAVRAASAFDVEAIPIATGVITGARESRRVYPTRTRVLSTSVREVFRSRVDGMLIGTLPAYWQARSLAGSLANWLPDTLVYAPATGTEDALSHLGEYNRKLQVDKFLPEATTVVVSRSQAGRFLGNDTTEPTDAALAMLDQGAHAVWLRDDEAEARTVEMLAHAGQISTLDYPPPGEHADPYGAAAALAALLARGVPLHDAIERAHRYAAGLTPAVLLPAR